MVYAAFCILRLTASHCPSSVMVLYLLSRDKDNKAQSTDGHGEGVIEVGYDIRRREAGKGGCGKELRTVGDDGLTNA